MKRLLILGTFVFAAALAHANGQTNVPPALPSTAQLILTGVADFGLHKCAFLQIEECGQPARQIKIKEGEQRAGIEAVSIDAKESKVTVRQHGLLLELTLRQTGLAAGPSERDKDWSHTRHHAARARLDREEDARRAVGY